MTTKVCKGATKEHLDAKSLIEFVFNQVAADGEVTLTNDEISRRLGWVRNHGHGHFSADGSRYSRARIHAMECEDVNGQPCVGFRLNYRKAGSGISGLSLLDASGSKSEYIRAGLHSVLGWGSRLRQHSTENRRMIEQIERLADWAFAVGDKVGYRVCTNALLELDRTGYLTPQTLGELIAWAQKASE